jgi:ATP-binding cassette, subfamily C, bacterial exporter for protease/lipase
MRANVPAVPPYFDGGHFRRILISAFIFSAIINAALLSVPLYSLQVFARAIPSGNIDTLVMLTIVVVLMLTMTTALEVVRSRLFGRAANALEVAWRRRMCADVLDSSAQGRIDGSALADLAEVKGALTRPTMGALMDLPWTPLYILGIGLIHPVLVGAMLVAMVILVLIGLVTPALVSGLNEDARLPSARAQRLFEAAQNRSEIVRGLRMGPAVLDRMIRDSFAATAFQGRAGERAAAIGAVSRWVRQILQVMITALGAWLVIEQHLSFGGMIATSMLVGRGMASVEQLAGSWGGMVKSWQSYRRLGTAIRRFRRDPEVRGVPLAADRLALENVLSVNPRDQKPILRAVTFQVEPGETACILGLNRTGKTTLARVLAGVAPPTAGTARFGGLSLSSLDPRDPARGIGYLPQTSELLPGTVAENIARFMPSPEDGSEDERVIAAAKAAGIHDLITALPHGYRTEVADPAAPIGGSLARLIALARAGYGEPVLVVLDEPAAGMDENGVGAARVFVKTLKEGGSTVVVLSHTGAFIDLADRTFVLQNGMVAAATPRTEGASAPVARMRPLPGADGATLRLG